ncbi:MULTISPECIES: hypothetical protein [unclassified Ruminococcus]|uniref:hypothetical protein n=1 Tax=unclassified Ruminococcus TaxID=2608920 RepID=UPI00210C960E|nr:MULTISPECIES: hypothetical protein [unclassified Ruminococcus]MCQ4022532.1 hypothetical protein [Ruminococcus sp. zg-924]MCQ4115124.1 hypothetical protein [Ruminococcus sp. zg-921]
MKGLFFISKQSRQSLPNDISYYIKRYGLIIFLTSFLAAGIVCGCVLAQYGDEQTMKSLDFIFISNFKGRITQGLFEGFKASMSAYFLFYMVALLLGLSLWGTIGLPVVIAIKGIGAGLCAGYLISAYSFQGAVFYVLVMLPGLFLSSLSLLLQCKHSLRLSVKLWRFFMPHRKGDDAQRPDMLLFFQKSSAVLLLTAAGAIIDVLFTAFFSHMFTFT